MDNAFIASNFEFVADADNPDHALMRFEFLETLVRVALILYPPADTEDGPALSVESLLELHVVPTITAMLGVEDPHDAWSNVFRRERLYTEEVDVTFRQFLAPLQVLFERYSGRNLRTRVQHHIKKRFLSYRDWHALVDSAGMIMTTQNPMTGRVSAASAPAPAGPSEDTVSDDFFEHDAMESEIARRTRALPTERRRGSTLRGGGGAAVAQPQQPQQPASTQPVFSDRDARAIFVFSNMTVVDELRRSPAAQQRGVHTALTFTEFLEAIGRLADSVACPSRLPQGMSSSELPMAIASSKQKAPGGSGATSPPPSAIGAAGTRGSIVHREPDIPPPDDLPSRLVLTIAALCDANKVSLAGIPLRPPVVL